MSNQRDKVSFEFSVGDLPMLADALMISGNVAAMCGHRDAEKRLRFLTERVRALIPPAAKIFDDHVFYQLCAALNANPEWSIEIEPRSGYWSQEGWLFVKIGDRRFRSEDLDHTIDGNRANALRELLDEMTPLATRD